METINFFQNIGRLQLLGNLSITIGMLEPGKASVSILFTPSQSATDPVPIIPLLLKGTFAELDGGFFQAVETPIRQSGELQTNIAQHEQSVQQARARLEAKKHKAKASPQVKDADNLGEQDQNHQPGPQQPSAEERRKNYEAAIKKVEELNSVMKYAQALEILPQVADYPEKEAELKRKAEDLRRKDQQLKAQQSLF